MMINEILPYREYMKRYFYSMSEDAVPATTTANVSTAPVILGSNTQKHKRNFLERLAADYDEYKNSNI